MQQDTDKFLWYDMLRMPFNISKCKSLHMDRSNPNHIYGMGGCDIEQTVEGKRPGLLADNQLNFHNHSSTAVGKARRLLGLVSQSFINLSPLTSSVVFTKLLKTNP